MKKIGKGLQFFYLFALVSILSLTGFSLFFFINSSLSDLNYLSYIQESELTLEKIKKEELTEKIGRLIDDDKVRPAIKIMDGLEGDINKLTIIKNTKIQKGFKKNFDLLKKSLNKLLSFPETHSLFEVFEGKMNSMQQLAIKNNWKTLTRISQRVLSRTNGGQGFNIKKLNSLHTYVSNNVDRMKRITERSLLSQGDKNLVIKYLSNVETELTLWNNYLKEIDDFKITQKKFVTSYNNWIKEIGPAISLEKIEIQNKNKRFVTLQMLLIATIVLFIVLGYFFYQFYSRQGLKSIEENLIEIIRKSLVSSKYQDVDKSFNDNFQFEIKKTHSYIQKRMTFSSIFQKALPFSALLLNQNLKVIWANPQFCDIFKISDQELDKGTLGWDYIVRFTNLGENDPVLDSLKNGLSGIYQIQIRPMHDSDSLPFELYVSSITNGGQNYIMIFLYPLDSVNETIQNQVRTVIRPIQTTIKKMTLDEFDDNFIESIKEEYESANIIDILDQFNSLAAQVNLRQDSLLKDILKLEEEIKDHFKMINDLSFHNSSFKNLQVDLLGNMKSLKKNLVGYVSESSEHSNLSEEFISDFKELLIKTRDFYNISKEGHSRVDELKKIIMSLDKVKQGMKPLNETINILNNRITQNFDRILLFDGVENIDLKKLALGVQKSRGELDHLTKKLADFSNVTKYIDLKLTKASMIVGGSEEIESLLNEFENEIHNFEKKIEEKAFSKNQLSENIHLSEDKIIKTVEEFFSILKKNLKHYSIISETMKKFLNSEHNESEEAIEFDEGATLSFHEYEEKKSNTHSPDITQ